MEMVVLKMLFIASVSAQYEKHVYVQEPLPWHEAQQHCRYFFTDLSPMTEPWVEEKLKTAIGYRSEKFWIGLYKINTQWKWSGGGEANNIPWDTDHNEPDNRNSAGSLCWQSCGWNGWHNLPEVYPLPFFCLNLIVLEKEMSWEEALEHCREQYEDLTSLVSTTERLLALREIKDRHITEPVWIGLRYLGDRWLWVNGDPLEHEVWQERADQDHHCPIWNRCGALNQQGLWENWDCQEKLNFICY